MIVKRAAAVFALLTLGQEIGAQQPAVRVTTRLVEISIVAETKDGQPVEGLAREDFAVFDKGRRQEIAIFTAAPAVPPAAAVPKLPPDTYTNRLEQLIGPAASPTMILFDGLNTHITDQAYARRQIVRFIEQLRPGDRVALCVLGRGPRVLVDFTDDAPALLEALAKFKGEQAPSLDAPLYDPGIAAPEHFNSWLGELTFNLVDHFDEDRAFRTSRTLVSIASHLERLPGRKNLIWVSGSFPISFELDALPRPQMKSRRPRAVSPEIERAARALNNANVAVYPVDARGLMAPQEYRADRAEVTPSQPGRDQATFATMRVLASRTGGRPYYNANDLVAAMRRALDDCRKTYLLGYYPAHDEWNNRFREIKVEVARPGVQLHHRGGYFAQAGEPDETWYREQVLEAATFSPLDATRLGLTVHAAAGQEGEVNLELMIDARDITFHPKEKEGVWECGLDLWLVQLDEKEQRIKTAANTNNLRLNRATYDQVMQAKGLRLRERLHPDPKAKLLRVVLRDSGSGAVGSVTVPLRRYRRALGS
ncbi:MAG: VWA domain-containing protein [Bryobacteraceae bacterium]|nr:VWA domain-containing protein [Bryobacteraceae bacterium]